MLEIKLRKSTDITKSLFSTEQFDDIQIAKDGNTLIMLLKGPQFPQLIFQV